MQSWVLSFFCLSEYFCFFRLREYSASWHPTQRLSCQTSEIKIADATLFEFCHSDLNCPLLEEGKYVYNRIYSNKNCYFILLTAPKDFLLPEGGIYLRTAFFFKNSVTPRSKWSNLKHLSIVLTFNLSSQLNWQKTATWLAFQFLHHNWRFKMFLLRENRFGGKCENSPSRRAPSFPSEREMLRRVCE